MPIGVLLEILLQGREGIEPIEPADEACEQHALDGTVQIADIARVFENIELPPGVQFLILAKTGGPFCKLAAQVGGKDEQLVDEEYVGLDVEETNRHIAMAGGIESEGHGDTLVSDGYTTAI